MNQNQETLNIIFQDQYLVAINKPSGLLVHKSPIDKHETRYAMKILRNQLGQWVYPVHRLDKPTSGLLLFALSPDIAKVLSEQFSCNTIRKTYMALVRGYTPTEGTINHALKETVMFKHQKKMIEQKEPQEALTYYERLGTVELPYSVDKYPTTRYSLLAVHPKTGRTHQIRKHMKHISHPIIGDAKYGKGQHNRTFGDHHHVNRLLLAATDLEFDHPTTKERIKLTAPLQNDFAQLISAFNWQDDVRAELIVNH